MIRVLFVFFLAMLVYSAIKTVLRAAGRAYHEGERRAQVHGAEMVLDPQCRTYVIKDRATARRIKGNVVYFCSEDCANKHEAQSRT
jgi:YHS domain-containing protein